MFVNRERKRETVWHMQVYVLYMHIHKEREGETERETVWHMQVYVCTCSYRKRKIERETVWRVCTCKYIERRRLPREKERERLCGTKGGLKSEFSFHENGEYIIS